MLEKLQFYNQYLMAKMVMDLKQMRKKYHIFSRFCFLKLLDDLHEISSLFIITQTFAW